MQFRFLVYRKKITIDMSLQVLLVIVAVFLLFRRFGAWFFSLLLKAFVKSQLKKAQQQGGYNPFQQSTGYQNQRTQKAQKEGEINIEVPSDRPSGKKRRPGSFSGGEYVDFEEVE